MICRHINVRLSHAGLIVDSSGGRHLDATCPDCRQYVTGQAQLDPRTREIAISWVGLLIIQEQP